jgi:uncharacterized YigZ family protein
MHDLYRTIQNPAEGLYKEKGSKFLSFAYPVSQEESIKEVLDSLQKRYHDARHYCYAWSLKPEKVHYRMNDDGEPSGTAGKPIYGQIVSRDLTNLLVVVVRYFGGTKLGVGGLIRAYRSAASDALDHASIIKCKVFDSLKLEFEYGQMNLVMKAIKDKQLEFGDQEFDMECTLVLKSWKRKTGEVLDTFSKIPRCKITLIKE